MDYLSLTNNLLQCLNKTVILTHNSFLKFFSCSFKEDINMNMITLDLNNNKYFYKYSKK